MALDRKIVTTEQGTAYSEQIGMFFTDLEEKKRISFYYNPDSLYALIFGYIQKFTTDPKEKPADVELATFMARKRIAKLVRSAVDGVLLMAGDLIIETLTGSKDYPKKPKGVDRLEWYSELYARLGVSYLMQNDTHLYGVVKSDEVDNVVIEVTGIVTRPVTIQTDDNTGA